MGEFELIRRYFDRPHRSLRKAGLGIGDDCALLTPRPGFELAISTDMLVEGRHFFANVDPEALGWKALAVNLSDLAAMGAEPLAFTLALALPETNSAWLEKFSLGLFRCADQYGCELIGGDTTRGPMNICITVFGEIPAGQAIRRSGAKVGDEIWVSGKLGDAALGLQSLQETIVIEDESERSALIHALEHPTPRIALGSGLRGSASAMLDLSDGLTGDLGHILEASKLGANIHVDQLPISKTLARQSESVRLLCALAGGDDYELCFTAPAAIHASVIAVGQQAEATVTCIGHTIEQPGLRLMNPAGQPYALPAGLSLKAYDHFDPTKSPSP